MNGGSGYLVLSAEDKTGIFGGDYYLYFRRKIMLVFSAVINTGTIGGKYYWYFRRKYYWYGRR